MDIQDPKYFELLKEKVVEELEKSYPAVPKSMTNWMGSEITYLQDDLIKKQKEQLSEKWFYTYMKSESERLPRVDMLNLLSRYVGYVDWRDFIFRQGDQEKTEERSSDETVPADKSNRVFLWLPLLVILFLAVFILILRFFGIHIF